MINQEEYPPLQHESHQMNYYIDHLLEQSCLDNELFPQPHLQSIKQQIEQQLLDSNVEAHSSLSINLLQKQQCHSFPPQRFFEYVGEDILEEIDHPEQKVLQDAPPPTKRTQKTNKLSYYEQTRAIKIQRYRAKKTRRIWNRKISYDCRKIVADNRQRVNGRFVKKSPVNITIQSLNKSSCKTKDLQVLRQFHEPDYSFQDFHL